MSIPEMKGDGPLSPSSPRWETPLQANHFDTIFDGILNDIPRDQRINTVVKTIAAKVRSDASNPTIIYSAHHTITTLRGNLSAEISRIKGIIASARPRVGVEHPSMEEIRTLESYDQRLGQLEREVIMTSLVSQTRAPNFVKFLFRKELIIFFKKFPSRGIELIKNLTSENLTAEMKEVLRSVLTQHLKSLSSDAAVQFVMGSMRAFENDPQKLDVLYEALAHLSPDEQIRFGVAMSAAPAIVPINFMSGAIQYHLRKHGDGEISRDSFAMRLVHSYVNSQSRRLIQDITRSINSGTQPTDVMNFIKDNLFRFEDMSRLFTKLHEALTEHYRDAAPPQNTELPNIRVMETFFNGVIFPAIQNNARLSPAERAGLIAGIEAIAERDMPTLLPVLVTTR